MYMKPLVNYLGLCKSVKSGSFSFLHHSFVSPKPLDGSLSFLWLKIEKEVTAGL